MASVLAYFLVPGDTTNIEVAVYERASPYMEQVKVGPYRRECDCLLEKAAEKAEKVGRWKISGGKFEFTKEEFAKPGFELEWRRELLRLGEPDPKCGECGGTGVILSTDNSGAEWDGCLIGEGHADGILKDSVKTQTDDLNAVPVKDLDLDRLPTPHHIVTTEGECLSLREIVWFGSAVVVDTNWEQTVKETIERERDAILVTVNCHY